MSTIALPRPPARLATHPQVRRITAGWLVPFALAAAIAVWGLRGVSTNEFAHPDAPRHALNGVMIHDWITQSRFENPIKFAKRFYSHLPGTSIPYHPPLYPAFESLFYLAGGVSRFPARLAVAVCTFFAALLLFRLLRATHGGTAFPALCVAIAFLVPEVQRDASDIMLEMPSLVCVVGALWFLRRGGELFGVREAAAFGLLTATAVWTKQQAVFLLGVPFLMFVLARQWRMMLRRPVWLATAIVLMAAAILAGFTAIVGTGDNRQWDPFSLAMPFEHLAFYAAGLSRENGVVPAVIAGATLVWFLINAVRRAEPARNHLYLAWAVTSLGLLLVMPPMVERYLFFSYVPLVVLACDAGRRLLPAASALHARQVGAFAAVLLAAFFWLRPAEYVRGPERAANLVMQDHPNRVLYCGFHDGDFLFAVREIDPREKTIIIRGDKLPKETFAPHAMEQFARDYGVDYIVVERIRFSHKWMRLADQPAPSMLWLATYQISSTMALENGQVKVYRFLNPSRHPLHGLREPSDLVRQGLDVSF